MSDLSDAICKITGVTNTNTDCHDEEMPAAVNCGEYYLNQVNMWLYIGLSKLIVIMLCGTS